MKTICGNIVDIIKKEIYKGCVYFSSKIEKIEKNNNISAQNYILPGLVDAHVHIESSMLIPSRFAVLAVKHGTVATVSDPHEIANVLGEKGIFYMIEDSKKVPFKIYFGVPSCVPATPFETSGAIIDSKTVKKLLQNPELHYLSEMMNFPGVINEDPEVMKKIKYAKEIGKVIDGHAPGLRGEALTKYINAGITTDHEAFSLEEAEEKIQKGMYIIIREGSAAKNFEALYPLIDKYPDKVMLCTDDSHPDDLAEGHINKIIKKALNKGLDFFNVIRAATLNPKKHYNLNIGLLQENDPADFIIVDNLKNFNVLETYINGQQVYANGKVNLSIPEAKVENNFVANFITEEDIKVEKKGNKIRVIKAFDGELITDEIIIEPRTAGNYAVTDVSRDILKIIVLNRYSPSKPSLGFITGFNLKRGAIALSIAHDSHNIIAIGASDTEIVDAVNKLIENKGGIVVNDGFGKIYDLPLPVAGIMTTENPEIVANKYKNLNKIVAELGSNLKAPFMTLSFMALLVIPKLKIGDKGLFDVNKFDFVDLFVE